MAHKDLMIHDIFFDCPQCSHTIKVSSDLVGVLVECPDCANEFKVPEIRDGLNPRFRDQQTAMNQMVRNSDMLDDLLILERGLYSLMRRQTEQIKQIDFIEGNATLILKQLRLLNMSPAREQAEAGEVETARVAEGLSPAAASPWLRYSMICGWVTLALAMVFGLLLLQAG